MHTRIVQAVRKEKTQDISWHRQIAKESKNYRLKEVIEGDTITFTLQPCPPKLCNNL